MMDTRNNLFEYCLRLGDSNLILAQRLGEWCGHGPILEEDIALTNICLDLLGQSRAMLTYAGEVEGKGRTEDDLAYMREVLDYRNVLLTEQPNGDFAQTILKQFLYSAYQYFLYEALKQSKDKTIAALAEKSLKEVAYHLRHSSEWVKRLGDGTEESRQRIMTALNELWIYTGDMFDMDEVDTALIKEGIAADLNLVKVMWENKVKEVFEEATLAVPENTFMIKGSRIGKHTEHLGYILAEMQVLHRQHPNVEW
jgi:ring-1,2-phenylacetyl-CoA epoxidase subunit PaaC